MNYREWIAKLLPDLKWRAAHIIAIGIVVGLALAGLFIWAGLQTIAEAQCVAAHGRLVRTGFADRCISAEAYRK